MRYITNFGRLLTRQDRLNLIEPTIDEECPDDVHTADSETDIEGNTVATDADDDADDADDDDEDDQDDQEDDGDEDDDEADADSDEGAYNDPLDWFDGMDTEYEEMQNGLPAKLTINNLSEMVDNALSAPTNNYPEQSLYAPSPPEEERTNRRATDRLRLRRFRLGCDVLRVSGITFAMLISLALYLEQLMVTNGRPPKRRYWTPNLNAMGSIWTMQLTIFVMSLVVCGVWAIAKKMTMAKIGALVKPWINMRMFCVSCLNGATTTLIFVCSYERVACHLQDPFKGFCLAFAIVFYFLVSKRVMGLPKIFAATTAVVGLLIAVDYGMCDSYRCRGIDVPTATESPPVETGWQSRAIWAVVYIGALALWTLQWSLLENDVIAQMRAARRHPDPRSLATVSHLVAKRNSRPADQMLSLLGAFKARLPRRPDALLLVCLMHIFAIPASYIGGSVDIIQRNGTPLLLSDFVYDSMDTVGCHFGRCGVQIEDSGADERHQLMAGSGQNNTIDTVRRRGRRSLGNGTELHETVINGTVHLMVVGSEASHRHHVANQQRSNATHSPPEKHHPAAGAAAVRKINTDKLWQKYRNFVKRKQHQTAAAVVPIPPSTTSITSTTEPTTVNATNRSQTLASYWDYSSDWSVCRKTLLFCAVYLAFLTLCLQFLINTQSAAFMVAAQSLALPMAGIFWSLFEMEHTPAFSATFVWAPEVTGELICSVLGLPIVLLGLTLFGNAHLDDVKKRRRQFVAAIS